MIAINSDGSGCNLKMVLSSGQMKICFEQSHKSQFTSFAAKMPPPLAFFKATKQMGFRVLNLTHRPGKFMKICVSYIFAF